MPDLTAAEVFRDFVTDGVPSSGKSKPKKSAIRQLLKQYESVITAFTSNGGLIYSSLASLNADLAHGANSMAWVLGDATVGNNGVYGKIGASGTGSWTRRSDLPSSFIVASDAGAGTPTAIQATTSLPVSGSALVWMNVADTNTASPVTVSFNGGSALTIKTSSGNNVAAGGLVSGMIVMGIVSGTTFRLVSDQVSAAIVAAAEAAQVAAEEAAAQAEAATDAFISFHADGLTNDDANFATLQATVTGRILDLRQRTFLVTSIPTGNMYVNGFWKIGSTVYDAESSDELISSNADTGGIEPAYTGGVFGAPTVSGRSTSKMSGLLWSQNSRASRLNKNGVIASIYSWTTSLVGLILAGRQSSATQPQSVIAGCEECVIDTGSRNTIVSSVGSFAEGVSAFVGASRSTRASGWESAVIGSNSVVAGAGSGARFLVHVTAGVVTSVDILSGGSGYIDPTVEITDRVGTGSGATATVTVSAGVITGVTITGGGSGYSQDANAVNFHLFARRSMAVAGSVASTARGNQSFIGGSGNADTTGNQSAVLASNRATASGINSAVIASGVTAGGSGTADSVASGDNSLVAASATAVASGANSVALGSIISTASADRAMTLMSRRVLNADSQTVALGSASAGSAASANTKIKLWAATGLVEIASTLTQNKVFTDIAKMFENLIPGVEIPVGALVALDGRKVRLADEGDEFFSVHSRTYAFLLGDSGFTWAGRYLYDDHGEMLMQDIPDPDWQAEILDPKWPVLVINPAHPIVEDLLDDNDEPVRDKNGNILQVCVSQQMMDNPVEAPMVPNPVAQPTITVPIENPAYDPTIEQTPRSKRRADWTPMLLDGEAFMHVTADVQPNDYIKPVAPGVGGKSDMPTQFRCMEIMTPFDAEKGYAIVLGLRV